MISKVLKFSFVYSGATKQTIAPSIIHTHWMKAVQTAFGSDVIIIAGVHEILPSPKPRDLGPYSVLVDKDLFKVVRNILSSSLEKWVKNIQMMLNHRKINSWALPELNHYMTTDYPVAKLLDDTK